MHVKNENQLKHIFCEKLKKRYICLGLQKRIDHPLASERSGKVREINRLAVFSGCLPVRDFHIWIVYGSELLTLKYISSLNFLAIWNIFG